MLKIKAVLLISFVAAQPGRPGNFGSRGQTADGDPRDSCVDSVQDNACAKDGSSYTWFEEIDGTTRRISTNHCPNHNYIDLNPNTAYPEESTYDIPLEPKFISSTNINDYLLLNEEGGAIGILYDGSMIYSPYGGRLYGALNFSLDNDYYNSAPYAEGYSFDMCNQHAALSTAASYHSHVPPSCLLDQLGQTDNEHSPQIGFLFDGFPVYGPRGPNGIMMKSCTESTADSVYCVDKCGGFADDGSIINDGYVYRYYIMGTYKVQASCTWDLWANLDGEATNCDYQQASTYYPFTPLCMRGCCPSGVDCWDELPACSSISGTIVDGTTNNFNPSITQALDPYTAVSDCSCNDYPTNCENYQLGDSCNQTYTCTTNLECVNNICVDAQNTVITSSPTPMSPSECADSTSWYKNGEPSKDCNWVNEFAPNRCGVKNKDATPAFEACLVACDTCPGSCNSQDSTTWYRAGDPSRGCDWVADSYPARCTRSNDDGVYGFESSACPYACRVCTYCDNDDSWALNNDEPEKNCNWVAEASQSRCTKSGIDLNGNITYAYQSCVDACRVCPNYGDCSDDDGWVKNNEDDDSRNCSWVASFPESRCLVKGTDSTDSDTYAFESCRVACSTC